ncbi:hypothetical protein [Tahibacter amnicola]|uniref:Exo-alpha-sialidase n=1 Tax=Tahibacter amnicola TaxID=2976241 RepID=A0ABY6BKJ9_9GAMM|nr:hypothetical protein [Tahibacter amnicola]UXI70141.1 hypothetical protein N4264_11070 [Tahibacter amnicola]
MGTWVDGGAIISSPDGIAWTVRYDSTDGQYQGPRDVVWNGSVFVATVAANVMTSTDGATWQTHATGLPWHAFDQIAWDGRQFMGVNFVVATSPDGIRWTRQPDSPVHFLQSIASAGKGEFIAVYSNGVLRTGDDLFTDGWD